MVSDGGLSRDASQLDGLLVRGLLQVVLAKSAGHFRDHSSSEEEITC